MVFYTITTFWRRKERKETAENAKNLTTHIAHYASSLRTRVLTIPIYK